MTWIRNLLSGKPSPKAQERVALGRNDLCWCGSGKKYKKCHLGKDEAKQREDTYAARVAAQARQRAAAQSGVVPPSTSAAAKTQRRRPLPPEASKGPGER
jgi:hypothetical protein